MSEFVCERCGLFTPADEAKLDSKGRAVCPPCEQAQTAREAREAEEAWRGRIPEAVCNDDASLSYAEQVVRNSSPTDARPKPTAVLNASFLPCPSEVEGRVVTFKAREPSDEEKAALKRLMERMRVGPSMMLPNGATISLRAVDEEVMTATRDVVVNEHIPDETGRWILVTLHNAAKGEQVRVLRRPKPAEIGADGLTDEERAACEMRKAVREPFTIRTPIVNGQKVTITTSSEDYGPGFSCDLCGKSSPLKDHQLIGAKRVCRACHKAHGLGRADSVVTEEQAVTWLRGMGYTVEKQSPRVITFSELIHSAEDRRTSAMKILEEWDFCRVAILAKEFDKNSPCLVDLLDRTREAIGKQVEKQA